MPKPLHPVGIFGGTFNPIHFGHLRIAQELIDILGLKRLHLIPTGTPPHRAEPSVTARQRAEMAMLAVQDHPHIVLDEREVVREGFCYTVDTLTALRADYGPDQPLVLLVGADAFLGLMGWHRWSALFELAHIVVAHRPGVLTHTWQDAMPIELLREYEHRHCDDAAALALAPAGRVLPLAVTQLDISSTAIRQMVAKTRSPRYLLPDAVLRYIEEHSLYVE
ncbi:nicotinate-nucleotide adenylyltransferase [Chitinivorax tropicus]|uniref:Probable nicotinate-nucleotide adenylyltransferase n=1 Tax=Chitinivorax tropicus TaxID=714531 RepID=A0A840MIB2_9PROT|nr:nicotinate-nucleotide adenylyltransferase [Chitinivorax tropicus]MBB5018388.1 nicotinate-nucleotide adenylyltransferase [Chitinivorax tropicus]